MFSLFHLFNLIHLFDLLVVMSLFPCIPFRVFTYTPPIHQFLFSQFIISIPLIPFPAIFMFRFQKRTSPTFLSSQTMFSPRRASMLPVMSFSTTILYSKIFQHYFTILPFLVSIASRCSYHFSLFFFPFKNNTLYFELLSSS